MGRVGKVFLIVWAVLMTIIAGGFAGFEAMRFFGKTNLDSKSATNTPMLDQANVAYSVDTAEKWQSDWVRYNGEVYDYNEDIITFLIMGIDKEDEVVKEVKEGGGCSFSPGIKST